MPEFQAMGLIAELMAIAARTAPKAAGKDFIELKILQGEALEELAAAMARYGQESGKKNFDRDGDNVRRSDAVLLVGLKNAAKTGLDCGACGVPRCADLEKIHDGPEFAGPICAWRLMDLGIALGSAAKMAGMLNADNRIMYRIGVVARKIGLMDADVIAGIPIAATGKNIYFDR
ncbi:ferredoxin domain-containing protein [Moorella sp. ACPs]|uniref:ferredoxin domain-containing protein n=1 Tax=Neomoorella carbonis TaxID=3062783 RepID=UPI003253BB35